jgi:hypothetical protein
VENDVRVLLRAVPPHFLAGLRFIRLTATIDFTRNRRRAKRRSRGRSVALTHAAGLYQPAQQNRPAAVDLHLDKLFGDTPAWVLRFPIIRRLTLADTLYHEIGHHIHMTKVPEHREREDVAERWSARLYRRFVRTHYWYLMPLVYALLFSHRMVTTVFRQVRRYFGEKPAG